MPILNLPWVLQLKCIWKTNYLNLCGVTMEAVPSGRDKTSVAEKKNLDRQEDLGTVDLSNKEEINKHILYFNK